MSLLLDALKKAANDKERLSNVDATEQQESPKVSAIRPVLQDKSIELQSSPIERYPDDSTVNDEPCENEPLTLDFGTDNKGELSQEAEIISNASVEKATVASVVDASTADVDSIDQQIDGNQNAGHAVASDLIVSDEALSLLIDKTNRDEKQKKIKTIVSVVMVSVLILFSGGLYYYTDMESEIASLERKHQIAMQRMKSKTNSETPPEKTAIIRNLVSDVELEEKVEYAKAKLASEKKLISKNKQNQVEHNETEVNLSDETQGKINQSSARASLTITRTKSTDPVGEKLEAGWLAYENGRYNEAKQLYNDVLKIEKGNRDAQLGLGAIAVIEKDNTLARRMYLTLLEQDPRDPIATAALAGLNKNSNKESLKKDNDYLLAMLEKNSDAPHLNFSIGNKYAQQKKWKSAQQHYFKAWQHDSENADYLFNLAVSMDQLGKTQQAIKFYRGCLEKSKSKQVSFSASAVQTRIDALSGL